MRKPYVELEPAVIEQARQMDLLTYLRNYEPSNLVRVSGNVYCTKEHDSLKISNGKWYWWSRGFGGISALDYLIKVKEAEFVEAVEIITGRIADYKPPPSPVKETPPKPLLLPPKNRNNERVTNYLFGRGIDYQLISDCIAESIIYESADYHNAVFIGRDKHGIPKYAACRSTLGSDFKRDAAGRVTQDMHRSKWLPMFIKDDDRRFNAQRFEEQFYQPKSAAAALEETKEPVPQASASDQETLLKLLANPEIALLKTLAKNL